MGCRCSRDSHQPDDADTWIPSPAEAEHYRMIDRERREQMYRARATQALGRIRTAIANGVTSIEKPRGEDETVWREVCSRLIILLKQQGYQASWVPEHGTLSSPLVWGSETDSPPSYTV